MGSMHDGRLAGMMGGMPSAGSVVDARDSAKGYSALHHAAMAGSKEAVDLLLQVGADVNLVGADDTPPLWACINNRNGWVNNPAGFTGGGSVCSKALCCDALLASGADPNASGWTDDTDGERMQSPPPLFQALLFESDNDQPEFPA